MRIYKKGPLSARQIVQISGIAFLVLLPVFWLISGDLGFAFIVSSGGAAGGAFGRLLQRWRHPGALSGPGP